MQLTAEQRDKVAANWPLVRWGMGKVHKEVADVIGQDALYDVAVDSLIHAVVNHDPARGELVTLFGWRYFRRVCHLAKRDARRPRVNQMDDRLNHKPDRARPVEDAVASREEYDRLLAAISTLNPDERDLLTRRYLDGETTSATCERLRVSHQTVYNRIEAIRAKLNPAD